MTKSSEYMIIGLLWLILADVGSQGWVRVLAYTLASVNIGDPELDNTSGSVNLKCVDQYTDIIQRMGHARYWFRLWGNSRAG